MENVWGDEIEVKLDTFHAKQVCTFLQLNLQLHLNIFWTLFLQRIIRSIKNDTFSGKSKGFKMFFHKKIRLLFRRKDDRDEERLKETATAEEIVTNIDALLEEYESVLRYVITIINDTIVEICFIILALKLKKN